MLQNLLQTLSLTPSSQIVFLDLIHHGESLASLMAKRTNLKRPTVYAALENLVNLGLATKFDRRGVTYFKAVDPSLIPKIFTHRAQKQFTDIKQASELLSVELSNLKQPVRQDIAGYSISTVDSPEAVYANLEDALLGGDFCAIFNPQKALKLPVMQKFVINFLNKTAITKPFIREIAVSGPLTDFYLKHINNPNHQVKQIPADKKICSDMIFLKGNVLLLHYEPNQEIGIKIVQKDYYESMMTIFEMLWEKLPSS